MLIAYTALRLLQGHGARYHYDQAGKSISISPYHTYWIESMLHLHTAATWHQISRHFHGKSAESL